MSTGIQGTPVLGNSREFYKQYAKAKQISENNVKQTNGTEQGDPAISLGNGLAIKVSTGDPKQRHKFGGPKIATLTIDQSLVSRQGKTCHWGDYPIFASFTYTSRRDLHKQLNRFMQGWRDNENKKGNDFEQTTLQNYHNKIQTLKEQLDKTSSQEDRQNVEENLATLQQQAQGVYRALQTFVQNIPDDKAGNSGNSNDKAKVSDILNKFSEFKPT